MDGSSAAAASPNGLGDFAAVGGLEVGRGDSLFATSVFCLLSLLVATSAIDQILGLFGDVREEGDSFEAFENETEVAADDIDTGDVVEGVEGGLAAGAAPGRFPSNG